MSMDLSPAATAAAIVSTVGGTAGLIVAVRTYFWRKKQEKSWLQNEQFQNDSHTLKLCQSLSDPNVRLQMAAAALLFERLRNRGENPNSAHQNSAIIQALLAATIGKPSENGHASPELCKYVADSIVKSLGAKNAAENSNSPLKGYYWQKVRLTDADWADVDARGLDLFGSNLDKARLRRANLNGTVFYGASLIGTKFCGADLSGADFRNADIRGANFHDDVAKSGAVRRTNLTEAKFEGAEYDNKTLFPLDWPESQADELGMKRTHNNAIAGLK
jgi:uncharacterized protein YjbI with pentapeptide repeats